jgi:N-acyl-L-homoserine lactone synthetase
VLRKFIDWTRYTGNNTTDDPRHFLIYIELMELIRKDMGHPKSAFKDDDFWKLVMTSDLEIDTFKKTIANYK